MERDSEKQIQFCQQPSNTYLQMLEDCGDDPRIVAGKYALNRSGDGRRGWLPDYDARDARNK